MTHTNIRSKHTLKSNAMQSETSNTTATAQSLSVLGSDILDPSIPDQALSVNKSQFLATPAQWFSAFLML